MELDERCRAVLDAAWHSDPGFCVPNQDTYPHQWLWDSCFHSVAWAALGDDRCVQELESVLASQRGDGFVPHMTYWSDPEAGKDFWGRPMVSTITQPPMYGHALRFVSEAGFDISASVIRRAQRGLEYVLGKVADHGMVSVEHPWETGCDDSARWDDWCPGGYDRDRWREVKHRLVTEIAEGASSFSSSSVGYNALVAFNAAELEALAGRLKGIDELTESVAVRWNPRLRTWTDPGGGSGTVRTLDAMLALLVDPREEAFDDLLDPDAYGAPFGPCGVHRGEPSFDPDTYWRGPNWPQLTYLLALAGRRAGRDDVADALMDSLRRAAVATGFAEYWNPDTGQGGGAAPQTWTTLACVSL